MKAKPKSRVWRVIGGTLLVLLIFTSAACPGELRLPFSRYRLPEVTELDDVDADPEPDGSGLSGDKEDARGSESGKKIAGAVMFGSGVLLCSWGIMDWQTDDTQCCPARNTENVAKIVVGVVLVNAGLVYLIAGGL